MVHACMMDESRKCWAIGPHAQTGVNRRRKSPLCLLKQRLDWLRGMHTVSSERESARWNCYSHRCRFPVVISQGLIPLRREAGSRTSELVEGGHYAQGMILIDQILKVSRRLHSLLSRYMLEPLHASLNVSHFLLRSQFAGMGKHAVHQRQQDSIALAAMRIVSRNI